MAVSNCPWEFMFPDFHPPPKPSSTDPLHHSTSLNPLPNVVNDSSKPDSATSETKTLSFAQVVSNSLDISLSQLLKPCVKGDSISIKISEEEYKIGIESSKNCLHGHLLMA